MDTSAPSQVNIGQGAKGIIGQTVIGATIVEQQLLITPEAIGLNPFQARSPYKALKRFDVDDSEYFFGRYQLVKGMQATLKTSNLMLVLGASGSGKSSVVRAKLIPEFLAAGSHHHDFVFTPKDDPFRSLYESLIGRDKIGPDKNYYFSESKAQFVLQGQPDVFAQVVCQLKEKDTEWLIFIDQFEELFTRCTSLEQRKTFIKSITQIAESGDRSVKIVLAMRADFLGEFSPYPQFGKLVQRQIHLVNEMPADELELAIKGPAAKHGVRFDPGLAQEIISDVQRQAGSLPLMQYTLDRLWDYEVNLDKLADQRLNVENYEALGKVRGALEQHVNEIYGTFDAIAQQATKRIFLSLVKVFTTEGVEKRVSQSVMRSQLQGEAVQATIDRLINENLLVSSSKNLSQVGLPMQNSQTLEQQATIEIAHEILLTSWTKLQDWMQEAQATLLIKSRLVEDMARWNEHKRTDPELLKSSVLGKVLELQEKDLFELQSVPLTAEELVYIQTSQQFQKRELNRAKRVAMGASIGAGILSIAMIFSAIQMRKAETEQIQTSVALSKANLALGQDLEAQIEIIRAGKTLKRSFWQTIFPDAQLRRSIQRQAQNPGQERNRWEAHSRHPGGFMPGMLRFSPDGQQLTTVDPAEGKLRQWNTRGQQQGAIDHPLGTIVFSPDGQQLVSRRDSSGTLNLKSIIGQQLATFPIVVGSGEVRVVFSPDSQWLAMSNGNKGAIDLWSTTRKQRTTVKFKGYNTKIESIAFSPDNQKLATSGDDGTIRLWMLNGKPLTVIKASGSVLFSPDGKRLVTTGGDTGIAQIWDVTTGKSIASFKGHKGAIDQMIFSLDGTLLVTRGRDGTARLWNSEGRFGYADNQWVVFTGHAGGINDVAFSPDGKQFATGSEDGTVRLWDTDHTKRPTNFESGDRLWNPTGDLLAVFKGHRGSVNLAFRPDAQQLATLGGDGILHLWDITINPSATSGENDPDRLPQLEKIDQQLSRNCDWVRDYLKNNSKVVDRDRSLCDGMLTRK